MSADGLALPLSGAKFSILPGDLIISQCPLFLTPPRGKAFHFFRLRNCEIDTQKTA